MRAQAKGLGMGVLAVDMTRDGALAGDAALGRHLAMLPPDAPVIVMVHGYKYDPACPGRSPHATLFAAEVPDRGRRRSWAKALGASYGTDAPLCIGFGWPARGSVWQAWGMAAQAGIALAGLLTRIAARGRTAHLIAHSMGARVCLHAVAQAPAGSVGRVILLSAAAHRSDARAALDAPAMRGAEIVNVCSAENAAFDLLAEALTGLRDRTVGRGWTVDDPRWLDLRLDRAETCDGLAVLGFPIGGPAAKVCHWSSYTRPGVFALYRALLAPRPLPLARIPRVTVTPAPAHGVIQTGTVAP